MFAHKRRRPTLCWNPSQETIEKGCVYPSNQRRALWRMCWLPGLCHPRTALSSTSTTQPHPHHTHAHTPSIQCSHSGGAWSPITGNIVLVNVFYWAAHHVWPHQLSHNQNHSCWFAAKLHNGTEALSGVLFFRQHAFSECQTREVGGQFAYHWAAHQVMGRHSHRHLDWWALLW